MYNNFVFGRDMYVSRIVVNCSISDIETIILNIIFIIIKSNGGYTSVSVVNSLFICAMCCSTKLHICTDVY